MQKMREAHKWLSKEEAPPSGYNDDDITKMGFRKGYNLTVWEEMPGEVDSTALKKVLLQVVTGGRMGFVTGAGHTFRAEAGMLRSFF